MTYCIRAGTLVAGIGLIRLTPYQAWFVLTRDGNSIQTSIINLGCPEGPVSLRCVSANLAEGNRSLSALVLGQFMIDTAISLIIGLLDRTSYGQREITFTYADVSRFLTVAPDI